LSVLACVMKASASHSSNKATVEIQMYPSSNSL
jgi:hypothetical protein